MTFVDHVTVIIIMEYYTYTSITWLRARATYQNICPEVTGKDCSVMAPDAETGFIQSK